MERIQIQTTSEKIPLKDSRVKVEMEIGKNHLSLLEEKRLKKITNRKNLKLLQILLMIIQLKNHLLQWWEIEGREEMWDRINLKVVQKTTAELLQIKMWII